MAKTRPADAADATRESHQGETGGAAADAPPLDIDKLVRLRGELFRLDGVCGTLEFEIARAHQKCRDTRCRADNLKQEISGLLFGRPGDY